VGSTSAGGRVEGASDGAELLTPWLPVRTSDYRLRELRDRHYSTRRPGGRTVGPPGKRLALVTFEGRAGWVSWLSDFPAAALAEAYVCTFFRNEGAGLASSLIEAAIALTEGEWGPAKRWVTLIDVGAVRTKRDPGRCFRRAGFRPVGFTKGGHGRPRLLILERGGSA
jgi:hypothetical protein